MELPSIEIPDFPKFTYDLDGRSIPEVMIDEKIIFQVQVQLKKFK